MLGVGNTGVAAASLALDVRVAVGAGVFAAGNATTTSAQTQASVPSQKIPTYNAFEFVYRSDYGKVILLWENAETGQEVNQVPSEYHLQQYAATQRAQRAQQFAKQIQEGSGLPAAGGTTPAVASGVTGAAPSGKTAAPAVTQSAPAPAPAPVPVVVTAAAAAPVDIKV